MRLVVGYVPLVQSSLSYSSMRVTDYPVARLDSDRSIEVFDSTNSSWKTIVAELPFDTRRTRMLVYGQHLLHFSTQQSDAMIRDALVSPATP